jgi:small conductance mechanosensitive channel
MFAPLTTTGQLTATALLVAALAGTAVLAYAAGPWLKARVSADAAEAIQAVAFTLVAIAVGIQLIEVWNVRDVVVGAYTDVRPTAEDSVKALITLLVFGVAYTITRLTKRAIGIGAGRDAISNHQREILHHVAQILVYLPAVIFAVILWRVPVSNILLSAGALGVVIGLAARQTLGAVLAGFVLLFSRPFEVGDWVEIEGEEGTVTDISIVNTQLRTFDDELVMLPNDEVTNSPITNRSRNGRLRVQLDVGVDYDTDVGRAMEVAADAMAGLDEVRDHPTPEVVVDRFGDSAVGLTLRFWISDPTIRRKWDAQNAVAEAVKAAFETEGIEIPFPQRVLSGREQPPVRVDDGAGEPDGSVVDDADGDDADGDDSSEPAEGTVEGDDGD